MKVRARFVIVALAMVLLSSCACNAANHYQLIGWHQWGGQENGHSGPGGLGNSIVRVFVIDENGRPVPGVRVLIMKQDGTGVNFAMTNVYGCVPEIGYQIAPNPNPMRIKCSDDIANPTSTSDVTPPLWNHDNHRSYTVLFMKRPAPDRPGISDLQWWNQKGNPAPAADWLTDITKCPSTYSFHVNTPNPADYYSAARAYNPTWKRSFGQTFIATSDRALMMHALPTRGFVGSWARRVRWSAQIFEGGPDGPPMGPKVNLQYQYQSEDPKFIVSYGLDDCALKPGNLYYVKFMPVDGSLMTAFECVNNVYNYPDFSSLCTLFEDDVPVPARDLECHVYGMDSQVVNVGAVTGTVLGADGLPINEANIVLNPTGKRIITGRQGTYKCYNVPPGTYSMTVSAPGYQSVTVTGRTVTVGATTTTDFTLQKEAGCINIESVSVQGGTILPGATDIVVKMKIGSADGRDYFITTRENPVTHVMEPCVRPTFWLDGKDMSNYFTVRPEPTNPGTTIRGNSTGVEYSFKVDCAANAPAGNYIVQGLVDAHMNLQPNGSFEADSHVPAGAGPTGWDWKTDDAPSIARLSYYHSQVYQMPGNNIPRNTRKTTIRWVGAWPHTDSSKKQGVKLYVPVSNTSSGCYKVRFEIRTDVHRMSFGAPSGISYNYYYVPGTYYEIYAWAEDDGDFYFKVTPLSGQGVVSEYSGKVTSASGESATIMWGATYASGSDEMLAREFTYWLEDTSGNVTECSWTAASGKLPSDPTATPLGGWSLDEGDPGAPYEQILPGVPWLEESVFNVINSDAKDGSRAMQVWCSPVGGSNSHMVMLSTGSNVLKQRMAVKPCTTYKVSFWYKQDHYWVNPGQLRMVFEEYDASGTPYYDHNTSPDYAPPFHWDWCEAEPVSHGTWKYSEYSITTSPRAVTGMWKLQMDKNTDDPVADVYTIDDFRLFELHSYADTTAASPGTLRVAKSANIKDLKNEPDGTPVTLNGVMVTGRPAGTSTEFYIESDDRCLGILADTTNGSDDFGADKGKRISLVGVLDTVDGERMLKDVVVTGAAPDTELPPLALTNKALGGADVEDGSGLSTVGLFVTVWGRVNSVGSGYFYVDDGSGCTDGTGLGVKVIAPGITIPDGQVFARVTGFSSIENVGGKYYRVIRARSASDIVWN